jgi:hypothetical protein
MEEREGEEYGEDEMDEPVEGGEDEMEENLEEEEEAEQDEGEVGNPEEGSSAAVPQQPQVKVRKPRKHPKPTGLGLMPLHESDEESDGEGN